MKTGEGKTLVATLPAYLNALAGGGVHLVTVNDYLAERDAEWMGRIYRFLGLEVGVVLPEIDDFDAKRRAYAAGITYGTNNEFGFDYLRDNMAVAREDQVQRGHHFAIVDEVDSILIDEARTPLIISGRADDAQELYVQFAAIVKNLKRDRDYEVDEAKRTVVPTEDGVTAVEKALGVDEPLRARQPELRAPAPGRAARQGAVQAGRRLRRAGRRGEDRRRVHRPHPRGPALERGSAPGGRGEGAGEDQGGEPDPRDDHPAELLPHVRQARRHDRHRLHRGGRVRAHLRPRGRVDPHQPTDGPPRRARPHLQDRGREVRGRRRRHRRARTSGASPCSSARSRSRSRSSSRACSRSGASPTRCSTPSSTSGRRTSSPRPGASAR